MKNTSTRNRENTGNMENTENTGNTKTVGEQGEHWEHGDWNTIARDTAETCTGNTGMRKLVEWFYIHDRPSLLFSTNCCSIFLRHIVVITPH